VPSHRAETPPLMRARPQRKRRSEHKSTTQRAQFSSLTVSQVGIASALGIATIMAPLGGLITGPADANPIGDDLSAPTVSMPQFPFLQPIPAAVADGSLIRDDADSPQVPQSLLAPRSVLVTDPSRGYERAVLPGCFGQVPMIKADNGRLPNSMLCTLWDGKHQLRADAAVALAKLNVAYGQKFGHPMCITDGYRTLARQYAVKAERGGFAAQPGTSVHGLGRAVDLCDGVEVGNSATHQWMVDTAGAYGWKNPAWALAGGGGPYEPWHWEFNGPGEQSSQGDQ